MGSVGKNQSAPPGNPLQPPQGQGQGQGLNHNMTSAEVSEYAKNNLGIDIPENVIDRVGKPKIVNSLQLIEGILNELPSDVKSKLNISVTAGDYGDNWFAAINAPAGQLQINTSHFNDDVYDKYQQNVDTNFHPQNTTADSILAHEIGHRLEYLLVANQYGGGGFMATFDYLDNVTSKSIVSEALKQVTKEGKLKGSWKSKLESISRYAASKKGGKYNYHETIAEAVADYAQNGDNAKPLSKEIWKRVKQGLQ